MPKPREESERRCIVTGETDNPEGMIRFALDPQGFVTPDLAAKLPGRGAWVAGRRVLVEEAAARRLFSRAFRREAALPEGVAADAFAALVEKGLCERALSALGLARRAGQAVLGFDLVEAHLREGPTGLLLVAADAGADGAGKLRRKAGDARVIDAFASDALSAAFGKPGVVYAAIRPGREAERAADEILRLLRYQAVEAL